MTSDEVLVWRQNFRQIKAIGIPTGNREERIVFFKLTKELRHEGEVVRREKLILLEDESREGGREKTESSVDREKREKRR